MCAPSIPDLRISTNVVKSELQVTSTVTCFEILCGVQFMETLVSSLTLIIHTYLSLVTTRVSVRVPLPVELPS